MSSFTKHTAIAPTDILWVWENYEEYEYYTDMFGDRIIIKVPKWYRFDGTSIPNILIWLAWFFLWMFYNTWYFSFLIIAIRIQKVETDTLSSAWIHDYIFTDQREIWRLKADLIFLESLFVKNISKMIENKSYILVFIYTIKYTIMYIGLFMFSRFVWYKLDKKLYNLFR